MLSAACSPNGGASSNTRAPLAEAAVVSAPTPAAPACAPFTETTGPLPGVEPKHLTLDFWMDHLGRKYDLDEELSSVEDIEALNLSLALPRPDYHAQRDLLAPLDVAQLRQATAERREWARTQLSSGEYVSASGAPLPREALSVLEHEAELGTARPELRVALGEIQIHCAPIPTGFYSPSLDLRLDRNACSALRAQDVVRVIARWPNQMLLVEAAYSVGWLPAGAALSPPIPKSLEAAFVRGPSLEVTGKELVVRRGEEAVRVPVGTTLPAANPKKRRAHLATAAGFSTSSAQHASLLRPTRRALTRRAVLEEAFRFIGTPYGLGDAGGGRDCSRLVLDVFDTFDLRVPRHSSWQAQAGSFWIDIDGVPEEQRVLLFDAAAEKGIVLLHLPGHVMLYLGRDERGVPMVLHALGEYVEPCPGAAGAPLAETLVRVKNVTVSTLELGRGTSRTALLERVRRITVVGGTPGIELSGVAEMRPAADPKIPPDRSCRDSERAAIYVMPERPNRHQPMRVVTAMHRDPGPAALTLIDPDGQRIRPDVVRLGGPPFGQVATIAAPKRGRWKAVFADGNDVVACQVISVRSRRPEPSEPNDGPIWEPKYRWNPANENLYALFIERLFDFPIAEDRVWPSLHPLLRDAERNLLFDYRGLDEDNAIELAPDCADLPYALRSYFAWKMRLPFGYKRCTRGRAGKPPRCDQPGARDNLMSRLELKGKGGQLVPRDDIEAFELFANTEMRSGVHSSSGRTLPDDELTDFYPVPLDREALKPGTLFADPYGHLLVLSDWVPQGVDGYGLLVAVDAQPDGTVGQRRFWRGSFLFDPSTKSGGAGFKAFRPRSFVEEPYSFPLGSEPPPRSSDEDEAAADSGEAAMAAPVGPAPAVVEPMPEPALALEVEPPPLIERMGYLEDVENKELARTRRYTRLSLEQYRGNADDFYAKVEALINPRPLQASVSLSALIDALGEAVQRRVLSVDNGEKWHAEHAGEVIEMPEAEGIFLSAGPWEDFSTPSRDLRLLIAIDTVVGFTARVRAEPQRFGLGAGAADLDREITRLEALLRRELERRSVSYTRSDGSKKSLSLAEVVQRQRALEVAYNPNDCSEVRWGAAPGSEEISTCRRRAPEDQQQKLEDNRHWFSTRKRPPR